MTYSTIPYGTLTEHSWYVSDRVRVNAYQQALETAIEPGDRVLDLGCGTGILGLLAIRAGAGHVVSVDASEMISVARQLARANGVDHLFTFRYERSTDLVLDEPVDVVVCDQIGAMGWEAGVNKYFADIVERGLAKPDARFIPGELEAFIAPIAAPGCLEPVDCWNNRGSGLDLSTVRSMAVNLPLLTRQTRQDLLSSPVAIDRRPSTSMEPMHSQSVFHVERAGQMTGFLGMVRAHLGSECSFSNIPGASDQSLRWQSHHAIEHPIDVAIGDIVTIGVDTNIAHRRTNWKVSVTGSIDKTFSHSTFFGRIFAPDELAAPPTGA